MFIPSILFYKHAESYVKIFNELATLVNQNCILSLIQLNSCGGKLETKIDLVNNRALSIVNGDLAFHSINCYIHADFGQRVICITVLVLRHLKSKYNLSRKFLQEGRRQYAEFEGVDDFGETIVNIEDFDRCL